MPRGPVFLLTDFGPGPYPGLMKAVILSIAPRAAIMDLTHDVAPQDVAEGAFHLRCAFPYLPKGSLVVAVVDPGVGTDRRAVCVDAGDVLAVGPDNGLLSAIPRESRRAVREIRERRFLLSGPSPTFHGRDVFAPAAAHLARGLDPAQLGPPAGSIVELPSGPGAVRSVDRFGNLVTDLDARRVPAGAVVSVGRRRVGPLRRTYADVPEGALVALAGSAGTVEIAVRNGSAARVLGAGRGDRVTVRRKP
jgi:hypothetical protein